MADTKAYMVGPRALEQQMPSNRGLFYSFSRKWSKYPDCAPKRRTSKPCIKMDSSESWHFAQLSTQAFGNMAPSADHCPPFPASDQLWKRNSAHNQDILTTTPKTYEAISVIHKNLFIAHGETLIFIHLRENEGRRATMTPKSDTHSDTRGGTQCPPTPPTANIAEWARASSAACVPSTARASSTESGHEKSPIAGALSISGAGERT